jgi:hypothetical protein
MATNREAITQFPGTVRVLRPAESAESRTQRVSNPHAIKLRKLYFGAYLERASGARDSEKTFQTVTEIIKGLETLHTVAPEELNGRLYLEHQSLVDRLARHMSFHTLNKTDPTEAARALMSPIAVDATEAARLLIEDYRSYPSQFPLPEPGFYTRLEEQQGVQRRDDTNDILAKRKAQQPQAAQVPEYNYLHPPVVHNSRGDEFTVLPDGSQVREDETIKVKGFGLDREWNSPLPGGSLIDFTRLMTRLRNPNPGQLRSFTSDTGERVPFATRLREPKEK